MNCICCKNWGKCPVGGTKPKGKAMRVLHDRFGETHCAEFIHVFITPLQYEERAGKRFNGAVWVVTQGALSDTGGYICDLVVMTYEEYCDDYEYNYKKFKDMPLPLCALSGEMPDPEEDFEEYPPSDDWMPE